MFHYWVTHLIIISWYFFLWSTICNSLVFLSSRALWYLISALMKSRAFCSLSSAYNKYIKYVKHTTWASLPIIFSSSWLKQKTLKVLFHLILMQSKGDKSEKFNVKQALWTRLESLYMYGSPWSQRAEWAPPLLCGGHSVRTADSVHLPHSSLASRVPQLSNCSEIDASVVTIRILHVN